MHLSTLPFDFSKTSSHLHIDGIVPFLPASLNPLHISAYFPSASPGSALHPPLQQPVFFPIQSSPYWEIQSSLRIVLGETCSPAAAPTNTDSPWVLFTTPTVINWQEADELSQSCVLLIPNHRSAHLIHYILWRCTHQSWQHLDQKHSFWANPALQGSQESEALRDDIIRITHGIILLCTALLLGKQLVRSGRARRFNTISHWQPAAPAFSACRRLHRALGSQAGRCEPAVRSPGPSALTGICVAFACKRTKTKTGEALFSNPFFFNGSAEQCHKQCHSNSD